MTNIATNTPYLRLDLKTSRIESNQTRKTQKKHNLGIYYWNKKQSKNKNKKKQNEKTTTTTTTKRTERYNEKQVSLSGRSMTLENKGSFWPKFGSQSFFREVSALLVIRHCFKLQSWAIMMQPWENGKNPNFGPNLGPLKFFSWVLPLLVVRQCSKLSPYAISRKTNEPHLRKW